jgi:hypothetical protein
MELHKLRSLRLRLLSIIIIIFQQGAKLALAISSWALHDITAAAVSNR